MTSHPPCTYHQVEPNTAIWQISYCWIIMCRDTFWCKYALDLYGNMGHVWSVDLNVKHGRVTLKDKSDLENEKAESYNRVGVRKLKSSIWLPLIPNSIFLHNKHNLKPHNILGNCLWYYVLQHAFEGSTTYIAWDPCSTTQAVGQGGMQGSRAIYVVLTWEEVLCPSSVVVSGA